MNYRIGKLKTAQEYILEQGDVITPQIIFTTELDLDLYHDITSIKNWDRYGLNYFNDINLVRAEIKKLVNESTWGNLPLDEKIITSKYFVVEKDKRDEVSSELTQRQEVEKLFKLTRGTETIVGDLLHDKTIVEIEDYLNNSVGELFNYKELNNIFDGLINGTWHTINVPAEPNTVIMVSITNTSGKKFGGVREVGSNLDRKTKISSSSSFTLPVRVSSDSKIEVYRENKKIKFHITSQLS